MSQLFPSGGQSIGRPSVRTEKMALPRPEFPISQRISDYRMRLMERNEWQDRNDILTQEVIEWLETQTDWKEQSEKNQRQREEFGRTEPKQSEE